MRIDLWCGRASAGAPAALEQWCSGLLSDDEAARAARLRQSTSRNQFVVGRGMCRTLLARRAAISPSSLQFCFNPHGKPEVAAPREAVVQFNLAHTEGMVICGLAEAAPIGVDIERLDRVTNLRLAERYFARTEADWVASLPEHRQHEAFLRVWTLKEAFIKAIGSGLATPLDAFAFDRIDTPRPVLRRLDARWGRAAEWNFASLQPRQGFIAAVAMRTSTAIDARIAEFDPAAAVEPPPADL